MDLKAELKSVESKINALSTDYVDTRGKAQIGNLLDKIQDRQKLPNFVSKVQIEGSKEPVSINLVTFLKGINTEVPEKDKDKLKKLEKSKVALMTLIEGEESKKKK